LPAPVGVPRRARVPGRHVPPALVPGQGLDPLRAAALVARPQAGRHRRAAGPLPGPPLRAGRRQRRERSRDLRRAGPPPSAAGGRHRDPPAAGRPLGPGAPQEGLRPGPRPGHRVLQPVRAAQPRGADAMTTRLALLATLLAAACSGPPDIAGLYMTTEHRVSQTDCNAGEPASSSPPYFRIEEEELFGATFYTRTNCESEDPGT